jgi:hypothetical protein
MVSLQPDLLREYWRAYKPHPFLFPGEDPKRPINDTSVYRIRQRAGRQLTSRSLCPVRPHQNALVAAFWNLLQNRCITHLPLDRLLSY